jgi:hypothetical protein
MLQLRYVAMRWMPSFSYDDSVQIEYWEEREIQSRNEEERSIESN